MKKRVLALALALALQAAAAEEGHGPLPGAVAQQDLGGIISLACQVGQVEIWLGGWSINLCQLLDLFKDFKENHERFNLTMNKLFKDLDDPLIAARTNVEIFRSSVEELKQTTRKFGEEALPPGVKVPEFPQVPESKSPGRIYEQAYNNNEDPKDAEQRALESIRETYKEYFEKLEKEVEKTNGLLKRRIKSIDFRRKTIAALQDQLSRTLPGTEQAKRLVEAIFKEQDALTRDTKRLAKELGQARSFYNAVQGGTLQTIRQLDQAVSSTKARTPTLAAAQAAKRVARKSEDLLKTIKDAEEKTQALVEEAQNATSTRAAVQIAVKGLAQLTQTNTVMQSLLYQALAELAQQNVYTNQQLAYQTERIANLLGQETVAAAQEAANEAGYVMGQLDAAMGTVRGVREAWKSVLNPKDCNWYRKPEECVN